MVSQTKIRNDQGIGLPEVPEGKTQLAIPFVIKGKVCNHIVTAYIDHTDPDNRILEFYDSKGLTVEDQRGAILKSRDGDVTLGEFMDAMKEKYKPKTIKENPSKHKWDSHNCGVYVLDYIMHRAKGKTAEAIYQHPMSYQFAQLDMRVAIVHILFRYASTQKFPEPTQVREYTSIHSGNDF